MQSRLHTGAALFVAVVCCFAIGLFAAWALHGFSWTSPHPHETAAPPATAAQKRPRALVPRRARVRPRRHPSPHLTLVGTGGASWVSVRAGSPTGRTLYEGLISPSQHVSVPGARFVIRVQGGGNLDAMFGRRQVDLTPYEMQDVLVTAGGVRLLTSAPPPPVVAS